MQEDERAPLLGARRNEDDRIVRAILAHALKYTSTRTLTHAIAHTI
jgi:hypothetical protein